MRTNHLALSVALGLMALGACTATPAYADNADHHDRGNRASYGQRNDDRQSWRNGNRPYDHNDYDNNGRRGNHQNGGSYPNGGIYSNNGGQVINNGGYRPAPRNNSGYQNNSNQYNGNAQGGRRHRDRDGG